jgi:hypothetical protein
MKNNHKNESSGKNTSQKEPMRAKKAANMINPINQQNPKLKKAKSKEQSI